MTIDHQPFVLMETIFLLNIVQKWPVALHPPTHTLTLTVALAL